jgi:hypothetical protein
MADKPTRPPRRARGRWRHLPGLEPPSGGRVRGKASAPGVRRSDDRRHPLAAVAMVVPVAVLLEVAFGGWDAVVTQASSVGEMLGR